MTTRSPPAEPAGDRRIADRRSVPALTGIRGYAACWVVLFHAVFVARLLQPALPPQDAFPLLRRGYLAVDLFFVLSGYVLMLSYGEAIAQRGYRAWWPFAVGRLFRILPLHWTVLALLLLLTWLWPEERWIGVEPGGPALLVQNLALVQGWLGNPLSWNTPAWSLSGEWLAYLAFPVAAPWISRMGVRACIGLIAATGLALAFAAGWRGGGGLNHVHALGLARCLCEFPMGMAGHRLHRLNRPADVAAADRLVWAGLALFGVALASPRLDAAAAPAFLLMVMGAGGGSGVGARLFGTPAAVLLGEISFSLYLIHFMLLDLAWVVMRRLAPATPAWVAGTVAGACLLLLPAAHLTRRLVERPGQAFGRRLQRRRP